MTKIGHDSIEIAPIDDEMKKTKFSSFPNSLISLLVSRSDMPNIHCFSIGATKNQLDAISESFGTSEEIIISLTRLPSPTYSILPYSLLLLKFWTFFLSLLFSISEIILSQNLT